MDPKHLLKKTVQCGCCKEKFLYEDVEKHEHTSDLSEVYVNPITMEVFPLDGNGELILKNPENEESDHSCDNEPLSEKLKEVKDNSKFSTVQELLFSDDDDDDDGIDHVKSFMSSCNNEESECTDSSEYDQFSDEDVRANKDLLSIAKKEFDKKHANLMKKIELATTQSQQDRYVNKLDKISQDFAKSMKVFKSKDKEKRKNKIWKPEEESELLHEYKKYKDLNLKTSDMWKIITTNLNNKKYTCDPSQVKRKFHTLFNKYRKTKQNNNSTGCDPKTCSYYDVFEDMCAKQANVTSVYALSSLKPNPRTKNDNKAYDKLPEESFDVQSEDNVGAKKENKPKMEEKKIVKRHMNVKENESNENILPVVVKKRKTRDEIFLDTINDNGRLTRECLTENSNVLMAGVKDLFKEIFKK